MVHVSEMRRASLWDVALCGERLRLKAARYQVNGPISYVVGPSNVEHHSFVSKIFNLVIVGRPGIRQACSLRREWLKKA